MIRLPHTPPAYTSRQITCVSCQETFSVAEEFFHANQSWKVAEDLSAAPDTGPQNAPHQQDGAQSASPNSDNPDDENGRFWRLVPDRVMHTRLRYQPQRTQRPVTTAPRSEPGDRAHGVDGNIERDTYINCPRCGADNRNWVQMQEYTVSPLLSIDNYRNIWSWISVAVFLAVTIAAGGALLFLTPESDLVFLLGLIFLIGFAALLITQVFLQAHKLFAPINGWLPFTAFGFALLMALATAVVILIRAKPEEIQGHFFIRALPVVVCIILVAFMPAAILPRFFWLSALLKSQQKSYLPQLRGGRPWRGFILGGLIIVFGFAVIAPATGYVLLPLAISRIIDDDTSAAPISPRTPVQDLQTSVTDYLQAAGEDMGDTLTAVGALQNELRAYLETAPPDPAQVQQVQAFIDQLQQQQGALPPELRIAVTETTSELQAYVALAPQPSPDPFFRFPEDVPRAFLFMWIGNVSLVGLVALGFTWFATYQYVKNVQMQVPAPIFHSVANMTRIVAWEAGQSLEAVEAMQQVQWMEVARNGEGGITLYGLRRGYPRYDRQGRIVAERVRGQQYEVVTDMWGRILYVETRDVLVPPTLDMPQYTVPQDVFNSGEAVVTEEEMELERAEEIVA